MNEINLPVSLTIPEMNGMVNDTAQTGLESGLTDPGLSCGFVDPGFTCGLLCFAVKLVSTITSSCQRDGCLQADEGAEAQLRAGGPVPPQEGGAESHRVLRAGQLFFTGQTQMSVS